MLNNEMLGLTRGAGVSLWRQIMTMLEREITGDPRGPGARLPTEAEYSARFEVNRHTVRRALEELEGRGLIRIEQGRGSFIAEDVLDYLLGPRTRFSENIRAQQREPQGRIVRFEELGADPQLAEQLRIRRGGAILVAERLGLADGRPVVLGAHYIPLQRFPQMRAALTEDPSLTRAFAAAGVTDYRRETTRITARMPTADEAELLQQARSRPLLVTEALNVDPSGMPIELSVARYPAGRVQMVVES